MAKAGGLAVEKHQRALGQCEQLPLALTVALLDNDAALQSQDSLIIPVVAYLEWKELNACGSASVRALSSQWERAAQQQHRAHT
jgi:hypothetical protein